ncbi:protein phosphatase 2C domain-containing protein [Candidatus Saccharibacteria bacterium]|nr:protein phosphatase 2C domain-containing protein [Candidatus Saccharibacteria bacterium]
MKIQKSENSNKHLRQQPNMDNPYGRSSENSDWSKDSSREADEEQLNADRQQRKIITALLYMENGHPNYSILKRFEAPPMPRGGRDIFLDRLTEGQITPENERELLNAIESPVARDGVELVMNSLQSKHERRILGKMTRGDDGFSNWQSLGRDDLTSLLKKYPMPMDFENASTEFLSDIELSNNREKRLEYEQSMRDFKNKIYGRRQEYWEQLKELHSEADARQRLKQNANSLRDPNFLQRLGNKIMELIAWLPGSHAEAQISKYTLTGGILRPGEKDPCQDSMFADSKKGIYGIFDGVGGAVNGSEASQAAARAIAEWSTNPQLSKAYCPGEYLAEVLDWVNNQVCREGRGGQTTASLVKIGKKDGRKYLSFAQVGDSRVYVVNKLGRAYLLTQDEGFENYITNSLGASYGKTCKQYNSIWLEPGDRVVVCSDGITGDRQPDLMSNETIGAIVSKAKSPRQACEELLRRATKIDDRSVIVFAP